ncbi:CCA tRNA nucleotidyltransferase [Sphingoaurantiacus capsulatus]|uniref:CCA tRNA nucleotidyltransferase n=1 Tax=Sphingoaurantiacus capsulatus TaxID=1771310 RepID=A0ABV7X942_9SPHN
MKLPPQPWQARAGAKRILAALGADTRIVGGAVRDALLGIEVADVDLATRLKPEAVVKTLEAAGIKAVPTGIAHGTITAVSDGGIFEVTTLRRDVSTNGRHAEVAFSEDWQEDASRRDFTINALYADPATGEIFDYFGGLDDLKDRRVRFIGDPLKRIAEDHLRILRFFRFHARFGGEPHPESLEACATRANDLMALSRERIRDELLKLLCVADPLPTLRLMLERGILVPVFPEIEAARLADLDRLVSIERALGQPCAALRRLAALLPADAALLDDVAARLRLSNVERKRLVTTADRLTKIPATPLPLAYRIGADSAADRLLLAAHQPDDIAEPLKTLAAWQEPRLPISGRDLIALGVPAGPEVSRLLLRVEDMWVEDGFPPDREAVLELARQALASSAR